MDGSELDRQGSERVANILQQKTSFFWDHSPRDSWAGFSEADLNTLVGKIAQIIGITETEAARITILFADDRTPIVNNEKMITPAICLPGQDAAGRYDQAYVLINRSKEVVTHTMGTRDIVNKEKKGIYQTSGVIYENSEEERLECELENPFEVIVSLIAEELKHAQVFLRARDPEKMSQWEQKYLAVLQRKGFVSSDLYDVSLQEVTASRVTAQVLEVLLRDQSPARCQYFRDLRQQSKTLGRSIVPTLSDKVIDETFIETGFDPKSVKAEN
ncbi:MAG: hypothetical protein Q7S44_03740 [bacterium]|nr:hypothetical protein [bacterium]